MQPPSAVIFCHHAFQAGDYAVHRLAVQQTFQELVIQLRRQEAEADVCVI